MPQDNLRPAYTSNEDLLKLIHEDVLQLIRQGQLGQPATQSQQPVKEGSVNQSSEQAGNVVPAPGQSGGLGKTVTTDVTEPKVKTNGRNIPNQFPQSERMNAVLKSIKGNREERFNEALDTYGKLIPKPLAVGLGEKTAQLLSAGFKGKPRKPGESKLGHLLKRIAKGAAGTALAPIYGLTATGGAPEKYYANRAGFATQEANRFVQSRLLPALTAATRPAKTGGPTVPQKGTTARLGVQNVIKNIPRLYGGQIRDAFLETPLAEKLKSLSTVQEAQELIPLTGMTFSLELKDKPIVIDFSSYIPEGYEGTSTDAARMLAGQLSAGSGFDVTVTGSTVEISSLPVEVIRRTGAELKEMAKMQTGDISYEQAIKLKDDDVYILVRDQLGHTSIIPGIRISGQTRKTEKEVQKVNVPKFRDAVGSVFDTDPDLGVGFSEYIKLPKVFGGSKSYMGGQPMEDGSKSQPLTPELYKKMREVMTVPGGENEIKGHLRAVMRSEISSQLDTIIDPSQAAEEIFHNPVSPTEIKKLLVAVTRAAQNAFNPKFPIDAKIQANIFVEELKKYFGSSLDDVKLQIQTWKRFLGK